MRKAVHFLFLITLGLGIVNSSLAAEGPKADSKPAAPISLDPTWKEFSAPPLMPLGKGLTPIGCNLENRTARTATK